MLDPALALGARIHLYPLQANLSPDAAALDKLLAGIRQPVKALLATHYFGIVQDFSHLRAWCVERKIALVEDCSHVLFTESYRPTGSGIHGHFVVSSPYKFFPSEDGGLLFAADTQLFDELQTHSASWLDELRGIKRVLDGSRGTPVTASDIASLDSQLAILATKHAIAGNDEIVERSSPSALFQEAMVGRASLRSSRFVVDHSSVDHAIRRRRENYNRWTQAAAGLSNCRALFPVLPEDGAPYMFPLHIDHPAIHFHWLKHLGVPIWRWDEMADSSCRIAQDYRLHLLHLPCHQALTKNQMEWMTSALCKTLSQIATGEQ